MFVRSHQILLRILPVLPSSIYQTCPSSLTGSVTCSALAQHSPAPVRFKTRERSIVKDHQQAGERIDGHGKAQDWGPGRRSTRACSKDREFALVCVHQRCCIESQCQSHHSLTLLCSLLATSCTPSFAHFALSPLLASPYPLSARIQQQETPTFDPIAALILRSTSRPIAHLPVIERTSKEDPSFFPRIHHLRVRSALLLTPISSQPRGKKRENRSRKTRPGQRLPRTSIDRPTAPASDGDLSEQHLSL
ncbi:hypothetical protein TgHK011_000861 [Trichoderma gracile]|nr:hypothetical protein TgHK011_000861 [Trichoderma gracile]